MERNDGLNAHDAQQSLEQTQQMRVRLAQRVEAPWWYHWGAAMCTAALFVGIGLAMIGFDALGTGLVVLFAVVGPLILLRALQATTGVSLDRYARGMGWWYAIVFVLLFGAFALHMWGNWHAAMFVAAALAGVATLVREKSLDRQIRAQLTGEHQRDE